MRRGNGEGSIFKLSGKRRKPYAVRITTGFTDDGKQKYKYVGYYEKITEAKAALREYLVSPSDKIVTSQTFKEVFEAMIEKSKFSSGTIQQYTSGFNQLSDLHNRNIDSITLGELEDIIDDHVPSAQARIKKTLNNIYKHALKYEYVTRNLADFIDIETQQAKERNPFTIEEINELWKNPEENDTTLILLYTGMRVSELLELECKNVNLENKTIYVEKSKTAAGTRYIPIHRNILSLIEKRLNYDNKYLITSNNNKRPIAYSTFLQRHWKSDHTIHETRHTFVTHISKCSTDNIAIKKIVGHALSDITEHYTHRTIEELHQTMDKLEYK